jgi:hypothetical protein
LPIDSVAAIESQNNFAALRSGSYFRLPTAHKNIYFLFFKKIFSCTSFVNLALGPRRGTHQERHQQQCNVSHIVYNKFVNILTNVMKSM